MSALGGLSHLLLDPAIILTALNHSGWHFFSLSLLQYTGVWDPSSDEISNCSLSVNNYNSISCQAIRVSCCHGKLITSFVHIQQGFDSHASQITMDGLALALSLSLLHSQKIGCLRGLAPALAPVDLDCYDPLFFMHLRIFVNGIQGKSMLKIKALRSLESV